MSRDFEIKRNQDKKKRPINLNKRGKDFINRGKASFKCSTFDNAQILST